MIDTKEGHVGGKKIRQGGGAAARRQRLGPYIGVVLPLFELAVGPQLSVNCQFKWWLAAYHP
jgi:hypothetical protein